MEFYLFLLQMREIKLIREKMRMKLNAYINIAGSPLIELEIRENYFSFLASNPFEGEIIPDQSCYRN